MAKDLPYFKFFCSEWNDGDITLEDYKTQGLFINICSYYWSNECDMTFTKLKKKFRGHEDLIKDLLKAGLIKECVGDNVSISFLDEQQEERDVQSKKSSIAGKASAEKRRLKKLQQESNKNPTDVEIMFNKNPTIKIREEKKREEESIEHFTHESFLVWFKECREYLGLKFNVPRLYTNDLMLFNYLKDDYTKDDFKLAFKNFSSDSYWNDPTKSLLMPKHFLNAEHFTKYLNAEVKTELTLGQKLMGKI